MAGITRLVRRPGSQRRENLLVGVVNRYMWHVNRNGRPPMANPSHYSSIKQSMRRARNAIQHSIPENFQQADQFIRNCSHFRNDFFGDQEFYSGLVDAGVHGEALLFIDLKLLRGFVNSVELHLDGIQPNSDLIKELVTLQFTFNDQTFVVAWIFMTKRTRTLYQQCLKRINHRCQEFYGRTPQPTTVKSDLGVAVVEALVACYPTATPRGCYFHLRNTMCQYCCTLGLSVPYQEIPDIRKIIKMSFALPLLPPEKIEEGLREIAMLQEHTIQQLPIEIAIAVARYLQYIRSFWIERIGVERLAVDDQFTKTDDCVELFHRQLIVHFGYRLELWEVIRKIQIMSADFVRVFNHATLGMSTDLVRIFNHPALGRQMRAPRRRIYRQRNTLISTAKQNLSLGSITVQEFLEKNLDVFYFQGAILKSHEEGKEPVFHLLQPRSRSQAIQGRRGLVRQREPERPDDSDIRPPARRPCRDHDLGYSGDQRQNFEHNELPRGALNATLDIVDESNTNNTQTQHALPSLILQDVVGNVLEVDQNEDNIDIQQYFVVDEGNNADPDLENLCELFCELKI